MSESMDGLDERLTNWKRWLRRYGHSGQACSLEGNYRSPQIWYPPGPRPIAAMDADAWEVCLAAATLPIPLHLLLRLKYVIEFEDRIIASIFREEKIEPRCKTTDIPAIDWEARCTIVEALSQPIVIRRDRAVARARQIIQPILDTMID